MHSNNGHSRVMVILQVVGSDTIAMLENDRLISLAKISNRQRALQSYFETFATNQLLYCNNRSVVLWFKVHLLYCYQPACKNQEVQLQWTPAFKSHRAGYQSNPKIIVSLSAFTKISLIQKFILKVRQIIGSHELISHSHSWPCPLKNNWMNF